MQGCKNNNDPWVPLPQTNGDLSSEDTPNASSRERSVPSNGMFQAELPQNPLHQLIDSQRYIETLEKKLEKLKTRRKEPTSKDIINSLALFQEDQMKRYVNSDCAVWTDEACGGDETLASSSFLKKKLHPEQQALTAEELIELIKSDAVAISHEESNLSEDQNTGSTKQANTSIEIQNEENKIADAEN